MASLLCLTATSVAPLAFIFGGVGPYEMMIVGIIAVLLFGKRLPSVARSMGQSFTEFKKGMSGIEDEIRSAGSKASTPSSDYVPPEIDERAEATAPKFEPPMSEPQEEKAVSAE
jgi:sec-independent protein translocase protein TatA